MSTPVPTLAGGTGPVAAAPPAGEVLPATPARPGSRAPVTVERPAWAPDADERGTLDIDPVVLRKIVEFGADQVPGTLHRERRVAGLEVGAAGPTARVSTAPAPLSGEEGAGVDVRLALTLAYPAPVRQTIDAVRARIADDLLRLSGHRLRSFAVVVEGLRSPHAHHTRPL